MDRTGQTPTRIATARTAKVFYTISILIAATAAALLFVPSTPEAAERRNTDSEAPFTLDAKQGGEEDVMVLEDVTVGEHGGYRRFTLEFTGREAVPGGGIPKWWAAMTEAPYQDLEGNTVGIDGKHYIELTINGNEDDLTTAGPDRMYDGGQEFGTGGGLVQEAGFVPAYENNTLVLLIGLAEKAPFRVTELEDPARLVIEVKK